MGDEAERVIENGLDELAAHQMGDCEFGCPYCEPQPPRPRRKVRKAPRVMHAKEKA